jgi:hypothetical protein
MNNYSVFCMHEQYNTQSVLKNFTENQQHLYYSTYEDVFVRENKTFADTLNQNTIGVSNIAIGGSSMFYNISGDDNISIGNQSLYENETGVENVVLGNLSLTGNLLGNGNTVIGFNSLAQNEIGNYNIVLGHQAGPSNILATNSNNCIYIGNSAGNLSTSNTNEIIIGATANGNGSNSVTLGNDNITKTILKGNIGIGVTATPATVNVKGTLNYVVNTASTSFTANGEIVYYGNGVGMTAGHLYALERDTGNWVEADNKNYYDCHLAIALGSTTEFGMLTKGYVSSNLSWYSNMKTGRAQYLGNTASQFQEDPPNSGTLRVRIVGYPVGTGATTSMLYFNPDNMWLAQSVYNTV